MDWLSVLQPWLPVLAPAVGYGVAGTVALSTVLASSRLVDSLGVETRSVLKQLVNHPGLVLGIIVCTAGTANIASISKNAIPPTPPTLPANPTAQQIEMHEREKEAYRHSLKLYQALQIGCIAFIGVVTVGGVVLAFKLSQLDLQFVEVQKTGNVPKEVKAIFFEAANCGSPSFALAHNDTSERVSLISQHSLGVTGGELAGGRSYTIDPGHYKIVAGNANSWGIGAGLRAKIDGKGYGWKHIRHGEFVSVSKLEEVRPGWFW